MSFHLFHINEVYSNADGSVQFIEFVGEADNQHLWEPRTIVGTTVFNIPANLPSNLTNGKSVLVATQAFADLGLVQPNYIVPAGFLAIVDGSVSVPGMDSLSWSLLPTNGSQSINGNGTTVTNSPRNFAGQQGPANLLVGTASASDLVGTGADDYIVGLAGGDTISDDAGNDFLDGGTGDDTMSGGDGNDTYVRDAAGDSITELDDQGTDTVRSSITDSLGEHVENLTLTGNGDINGTGNEEGNVLTGNSGANTLFGQEDSDTLTGGGGGDWLDGGSGDDTMAGDAGNDTYVRDSQDDEITESSGQGTDTVLSSVNGSLGPNVENLTLIESAENGTGNGLNNVLTGNKLGNVLNGVGGNDTLNGNDGNDTLNGGDGNDTLDGEDGDDTMAGNAGNDTYVRGSTGDAVTEQSGQGTDTVRTSVGYSLPDHVENLTLTGDDEIDGSGNEGNNVLTGNSDDNALNGLGGNDTVNGGDGDDTLSGHAGKDKLTGGSGNDLLDGGSSNDTMAGGTGNDTYVRNLATDTITESKNQGTDRVLSSIGYTLGSNLEHLTLTDGNVNGTGNGLNNSLTGSAGKNTLNGGAGNDTLDGGEGIDTLLGGSGNDILLWDPLDTNRNGGAGTDTLRLTGDGETLNLLNVANSRIQNIERIDITGGGNNTLILNRNEVLNISTTSNSLRVDGDTGDSINMGTGWSTNGLVNDGYITYTQNSATLLVDVDITVVV